MAKTTVKKAFLLVGNKDWGKTDTLKQPPFTISNSKKRLISLIGFDFFLRKGSNRDKKVAYIAFVVKVVFNYLILAFATGKKYEPKKILTKLKSKGYKIYAFVLKYKYGNPNKIITDSEIAMLKQYATKVEVYSVIKAEAKARAVAFNKFIKKNMP